MVRVLQQRYGLTRRQDANTAPRQNRRDESPEQVGFAGKARKRASTTVAWTETSDVGTSQSAALSDNRLPRLNDSSA